MSVPTTIQAKLVPLAFSTDDSTYKNVVCLKVWNLKMDIPTTDEDTQCGRLRAEGVQDTSFDFEIIANTTPNGSTEISAATILSYYANRTDVYARVAPGTGMNVKVYGRLYNVESSGTGAANLYSIKGSFKSNADPVIS